MTWADTIKARFLEAADTEHYLQKPRMANGSGYWPITLYTQEDRDGWDATAHADSADKWASNRKVSRDAISRHDECLTWSMRLLKNEKHRHIVWRWAFCQVNGWSFSESCKRRGWVRVTAYRRLDASFEAISNFFLGSNTTPMPPDEKYLLQVHEKSAIDLVGSGHSVSTSSAIPLTAGYRNEESTDLLNSPAALAEFSQHLSDVNEIRRKAQLRRAKAMRGVPGEEAA